MTILRITKSGPDTSPFWPPSSSGTVTQPEYPIGQGKQPPFDGRGGAYFELVGDDFY